MGKWFAAHIVLYVELKGEEQKAYSLWENIVLIKARSDSEAFSKAEQRGKIQEGDDAGTFEWGGKPARWVFGGVRKLTLCEDPEERPDDGTEISYVQMKVSSKENLIKYISGERVGVRLVEDLRLNQSKTT